MPEDDAVIEAMARAYCTAKGMSPDYCVAGTGWMDALGNGDTTCHRRRWEDEKVGMRAALAAYRAEQVAL